MNRNVNGTETELKVEEEIKMKLQLEAEHGKMHYVNSNNKLQNLKP